MLSSSVSKKPSYSHQTTISLSDFLRIQNTIIPSNSEIENRQNRDLHLKHLSATKSQNWPNSILVKKIKEFESQKNFFIANELLKRKIDEEEQRFQQVQNDILLCRAKSLLFSQKDPVKTFNSTMKHSDMLKEREFQKKIAEQKREINKSIEKHYYDMEQKQIEEYDRKEEEKAKKEKEKKNERMKIIKAQLTEAKIKRIREYQEKIVEGELIKMSMQRAIEDDKRKEEEIKIKREKQKEEYIKENEVLERFKEEKRKKEIEEEKKIEEFAFKKKQLEELRDKVANDKFKEKQMQRQKLIDKQIEHLKSLKKKEDETIQRSLMETDETKKKEEQIKQARYDSMRKAIDEQKEYVKMKKELKKIQEKKEEAEFVDNWKKKMMQLEEDEKQEFLAMRRRNKSLANFHKMQLEEKRKIAKDQFIKLNEESYQNKYLLEKENNDFMKYAEKCIKDYHNEGKDIIPMLLELKRYKKATLYN